MKRTIIEIEGIGPADRKKLDKAHISTVEELLKRGASRTGRKQISENSGIDVETILDWVNIADLLRLEGIDSQMAYLIKLSGVDTIKELRTRNPINLHEKLLETREDSKMINVKFTLNVIEGFINQAKELEPTIYY
ncbi:MAG: DUF4332 domain-containing protein [Bacteroidaceae bacterium]